LVKRHHALRVTVFFLIVAALVVGVTGCRHGADTYQLTVSSGSGGNVTVPGEGTFTYDAGTVVPLVAAPDDGYQFLSWTGDIAYIANPTAASTTITLNADCAILANFSSAGGEGGDHGGPSQP